MTIDSGSEASFDESPTKEPSGRRQTAREKKAVKYGLNSDTEGSDEEVEFVPVVTEDKVSETGGESEVSWPSEAESEEEKEKAKKQKEVKGKSGDKKGVKAGTKRKSVELKKAAAKRPTAKKARKARKNDESESDFSIDD